MQSPIFSKLKKQQFVPEFAYSLIVSSGRKITEGYSLKKEGK